MNPGMGIQQVKKDTSAEAEDADDLPDFLDEGEDEFPF